MNDNFNLISDKLETFIRKYYLFKIARGIFLTIGLIIFIILLEAAIEYFNYLLPIVKTIIFYSSLIVFACLLVFYFILPTLSLLKFRNFISYIDAAKLISRHFPEIDDKLLNTLELNADKTKYGTDNELIIASINKRINELSPLPFTLAVNFNHIKRNFIFFSSSVIVLLLILAFSPKILIEGTSRLVDYSNEYEPQAPFQFVVLNNNLICEKGKDFTVDLEITGEYIPENIYIKVGDNQFLMNKEKQLGIYTFTVRNINNSADFRFFADKYYSKKYSIEVLPAPVLKSFSVEIIPPAYTGIEKRNVINTGEITVPFGSDLKWVFNTSNVKSISFISQYDTLNQSNDNNLFSINRRILKDVQYSVQFSNENFISKDDLNYTINVIPDKFPEIDLKQVEDSLHFGAWYFMVSVKDDYGFYNLNFIANTIENDSVVSTSKQVITLNKSLKIQDVFHYFNFNELTQNINNGHIEYYFEIRDNDYISGYKATRTVAKLFKPLSKQEVRNMSEDYSKKNSDVLDKSKSLTQDIQKEIEEFKKKELRGDVNQYDKQNFLKNILDKQKKLDEMVENLQEQNKKKNSMNDQFYEEQKQLIEKQKEIQKLLDQILDDELKQLLKEIEELSKQLDEKKFEQVKDKLDLSYKNMNKKLDRSLELLKRYQVEENMNHLSEDLKKLSDQQEKLSEEKTSKKDIEQQIEKQEKLDNEFNEIEKDFNDTKEKNQELKSPYQIQEFDKDFKDINEKMDDLKENMPSNSKNKNSKQQQQISKDMKNLSEKMEDMMNQMNMQSMNMDLGDLRQIIDNLSKFSFNQEDNYNLLSKNFINSPDFNEIVSTQNKLELDYSIIRDSLATLASRVPQLGKNITDESEKLSFDLNKATKEIEDNQRRIGLTLQRQIINSANTLALYLEELMKQMENQMSGSSGQGKPQQAMQNLKKQQEKLKGELEQLLEEMRKEGSQQDKGKMNNQIVKSLAEQEIFNKMLEDLQNGKTLSPEGEQKLKEIKRMSDKNIDDLINKNITPELLKRNEQIKTRLLEAEKSEREREKENKRESKEGVKKEMEVPEELKESMKNNKNFKETLQKNNLNMKKYYQNLSNEYFRIINN